MFRLHDITISFNETILIKNYSLSIKTGEKLLITAPSGSGKSSLLKLMMGFIQAQKGSVYFQDEIISSETIRDIRLRIGYLSQDIDFPNGKVSTVLDDIFSFSSNKKIKPDLSTIKKQMQELKLEEGLLNKNINQLSGGERQRLGWVVLLLLDRPVLLLDEPTSALDKELKQKLINYISECDKTIVVVSHDHEWQIPGFKILEKFNL